jgi:hypothetical protein
MFGRRVLMSTCHRMGSFTTRQHPVILIANKLQISAFSSAAEHAECSKGCCCGTTLCWKCGNPVSKCSFFCTHGKCNAIQTIDTADDECNYFELLEMLVFYPYIHYFDDISYIYLAYLLCFLFLCLQSGLFQG